jgi:uncharacterized metal-binding protein YceD (DUF177 family)
MKRTTEFSRPIEIDRIPRTGSHEHFAADTIECQLVAKILKVLSVHALNAKLLATPWRGGGLKVTGTITIDLTQQSVISLEDFRVVQSFDVERYFAKKLPEDDPESDIELLSGRTIDLAAIAVETIGLEMDPYPRKPGEVYESSEPEVLEAEPEKVSPFAKLGEFAKTKPKVE